MLFTDEKPGSWAAIGKIAHRRQAPAAGGAFVAPARVKLNSQMQMFEVNEKQECRSNAPDRHSEG